MKKQILSLVLVLCVLCALLPTGLPIAWAYSNTDIAYSVESGCIYFDKETGTVTDCDEAVTKADIPTEIDNVRVTSIGDSAFEACRTLESITIPDGVINIGDCAFIGCRSLQSITIPKSVTTIGDSAFQSCDSLRGIYVTEGNTAFASENGVLFDRNRTTLLAYPEGKTETIYSIPDGVISIGNHAFTACRNLKNIIIPISVTNIFEYAFSGCHSLTNIEIPDSVTNIADSAFLLCRGLTSITIPKNVTCIASATFYGCDSLKRVTIPDTVASIEGYAFYGCSSLTSVTIPNSVTSINEGAFSQCSSLTRVNIPMGVVSIGDAAFSACSALQSVTLSASLTSIGHRAFENCNSLNDVYFLGDAPELGLGSFQTVDSTTYESVNIPGLTLYYLEGKNGWTSPTWNGYPTATWELPHEHLYTATVTAPTCTEKGYTTYNCECGDRYIDTYVDALGHSYENGVCVRCGEKKSQPPVEFVDVPKNEWYADAVAYAVQNGLMNGVGNDRFDPEGSMTRAMLVTVLWRYEGEPEAGSNSFRDVPHGQWYTDAVSWAAANGVVNGIGNGRFDPEGKITREQMATILFRYAQKKGVDTSKRGNLGAFPDGTKVSAYAEEAVQWTAGEGVINGSDGKLLPQGSATRAQVATILMRYIENIVKR